MAFPDSTVFLMRGQVTIYSCLLKSYKPAESADDRTFGFYAIGNTVNCDSLSDKANTGYPEINTLVLNVRRLPLDIGPPVDHIASAIYISSQAARTG